MEFAQLLMLISNLLLIIEGNRQDCNQFNGPSGQYECVLLKPYYNTHQWATCLSNSYIEMKSGYTHACRKELLLVRPKYCWNQCMLELHDVDKGDVYRDCECTPKETLTSTAPLSGSCFSPTGNDCLWFETCLKAKYPCYNADYRTLIELGSAFCNSKFNKGLSKNGLQWTELARKCFQVNMTPVLKPWLKLTCSKVNRKAKTVRNKCLSKPFEKIPTCNLTSEDLWTVFWNLRESFKSNIVPTLGVFLVTIQKCVENEIGHSMKKVKLKLKAGGISTNLAEKFLTKMTRTAKWRENEIVWYAEVSVDITILIATKNKHRPDVGNYSTDHALKAFSEAVKTGKIQFVIHKKLIQVESMYACYDLLCQHTYLHTKATYLDETKRNYSNHGMLIGIGVFSGVIIMIVACICFVKWREHRYESEDDEHLIKDEDEKTPKFPQIRRICFT